MFFEYFGYHTVFVVIVILCLLMGFVTILSFKKYRNLQQTNKEKEKTISLLTDKNKALQLNLVAKKVPVVEEPLEKVPEKVEEPLEKVPEKVEEPLEKVPEVEEPLEKVPVVEEPEVEEPLEKVPVVEESEVCVGTTCLVEELKKSQLSPVPEESEDYITEEEMHDLFADADKQMKELENESDIINNILQNIEKDVKPMKKRGRPKKVKK